MQQLMEWDFNINETVYAELDSDYKHGENEKFKVIERNVDEGIQVYVVQSLKNQEKYEAYPSMLLPYSKEEHVNLTEKNKRRNHVSIEGSELLKLRKTANLTTEKLAKSSGITNPSVTRYEKNQYNPRIDIAIALLNVLNNEITDFRKKTITVDGHDLKRLRLLKGLSKVELASLTHLTDSFVERYENEKTEFDLGMFINVLSCLR